MMNTEFRPQPSDGLASTRAAIAGCAIKTKAEGAVIVSSKGKPQNWLIDLRRVFMQREMLEEIAKEFWHRFELQRSFQLGAMETAAIPLLTALLLTAPADRGRVNGFIVRKERKMTGLCNSIEGEVTDEPIVLVDDIINSAKSAEKARAVIEQAGYPVWKMFAVIDYRSKKGLRWRAENKIEVSSLFTLDDFDLELAADIPPAPQRYRELWRTEIAGGFPFNVVPKSPPNLVGNRIYRGSDAGKMHCFDAATGAILWEYAATGTGRKGIMSAPLVHEDRIYFGAFNGTIYCLNAESGEEVWSQAYGEWVGSSPIVAPKHGLVYFGIEYARPWARGSIGAFSLETGARVWEHLVGKLQHGSPSYWKRGDLVFWGTADHEMVALRADTGELVWSFATRRSVKYAPAIDEERGLVCFASFDKSIYLLEAATGRKLGEWETGEICYTTPLFHGNRIFCGSGDRHFYVIDLQRMELIKKMEMGARVYASPKLIDGRVVIATTGGLVTELDPATLETMGRLQLPDAVTNAVAASEDGRRIYVSTYMNHLYAFERLGPAAASPSGEARVTRPEKAAKPAPAAPAAPRPRMATRNFRRVAAEIEVETLLQEIAAQPDAWKVSTKRQDTIAVQRDTESIFLRSADSRANPSLPIEHTHPSAPTAHSKNFPNIMQWVQTFALTQRGELSRVLIASLKPRGQVYRHHDHGDYYRIRDRYHLVLYSSTGSPMSCGDEVIVMRAGEVWWFENKKPHEAFNHSDEPRIHLIFDLLPAAGSAHTRSPGGK